MIAQLAGAGSLVDVTISDASLEEVIRTIYETEAFHREPTVRATQLAQPPEQPQKAGA